jgi:protein gp37
MAENSKIEWCAHTFNPWIGCTNCYAETLMDKRLGKVQWGKGNPRSRTSEANWKQVEKWNRKAESEYKRWEDAVEDRDSGATEANMPRHPRVFVASLADWLDPEVPIEWLADLLDLVRRCPHLDFLLLTKRPELWQERLQGVIRRFGCHKWLCRRAPENIWIGTSVEDQRMANERIPALLKIPAKVRFLSCEPLLGKVDLRQMNCGPRIDNTGADWFDCLRGASYWSDGEHGGNYERIHWVIVGGESGPNARPMHPDWARSLRDQCQQASVPFFMKQMGGTKKPFAPIPDDLMVREFPMGGIRER